MKIDPVPVKKPKGKGVESVKVRKEIDAEVRKKAQEKAEREAKREMEKAQRERELAIEQIENLAREKEKEVWSRGNPEKHKALRELDCYEEVHNKVCSGVVIPEIARWIQEVQGERLEVQRSTLEKNLYDYRKDLPRHMVEDHRELYVKKHIEKVARGVDEVRELEELYLLQLDRIGIDVKSEKSINKLFKGTSREIALARDILMDMAKLKQEIGLLHRVPDKMDMNVNSQVASMNMNMNMDVGGEKVDDVKLTKMGLAAEQLIEVLSKGVDIHEAGTHQEDTPVDPSQVLAGDTPVDPKDTHQQADHTPPAGGHTIDKVKLHKDSVSSMRSSSRRKIEVQEED